MNKIKNIYQDGFSKSRISKMKRELYIGFIIGGPLKCACFYIIKDEFKDLYKNGIIYNLKSEVNSKSN